MARNDGRESKSQDRNGGSDAEPTPPPKTAPVDELEWDDEWFGSVEEALMDAIDRHDATLVASSTYDDYGMGGGSGYDGIYEWQGKFLAYMPESDFSVHRTLKEAFTDSPVCGLGGLNQEISADLDFDEMIEYYRRSASHYGDDTDPRQVFVLNGVRCAVREGGLIVVFEEFFRGKAVPTDGGPAEHAVEQIARRPDGRFCILVQSDAELDYNVFFDLVEDELDPWLEQRADGDAEALERRRAGLKQAMEAI